jgi:molybdopterin-guanine dinucleotide biosynthesis protein B
VKCISIVGRSNSGKTTLLEKLIPELKSRNRKVMTLKHDVHGFEMDREGKDTWRHKKAGASAVLISSPQKIAMIIDVDAEKSLDELVRYAPANIDYLLTEGFKKGKFPKIEVLRIGGPNEPLMTRAEGLIAIVGDSPVDFGVPFFSRNDPVKIVDFMEEFK